MRGVRPGWTIFSVAGHHVQSDDEVARLLQEASAGSRRYDIVFEKGQGSFGTEAKERSDKEKRNRSKVKKAFPYQGCVEKVEHRGITYDQLERVQEYAVRYCSDWYDMAPPKLSKTGGKPLHIGILNSHHINSWVILPATKPKKCSFVEMLTNRPQPPTWFTSHWWGEPMQAFMESLRAHVAIRHIPADGAYWICCYANRQHLLQRDISEDPKQTGFYKAMDAAKFRVLLVLDRFSTPFSRAWCLYEVLACAGQEAAFLDIASSDGHRTGILTQGLTEEEQRLEHERPGAGIQLKRTREARFPMESMDALATVDFQTARANCEEDRLGILDAVARRDVAAAGAGGVGVLAEGADPQGKPRFADANAAIRTFLASVTWGRAMADADGDLDDAPPGLRRRLGELSKALSSSTNRRVLDMSLEGLDGARLGLLADSLPPCLQKLTIRLRGSTAKDDDLRRLVQGLPKTLKWLFLDLELCNGISDAGMAAVKRHIDFESTTFDVRLTGTSVSKETQEWYVAEARSRQESGHDGVRRNVARALGVSVCRRPESCVQLRRHIVLAVPELSRMLQAEDPELAHRALRALEGLGERAFAALDGASAERAQQLRAELKERDSPPRGVKAAVAGAGTLAGALAVTSPADPPTA